MKLAELQHRMLETIRTSNSIDETLNSLIATPRGIGPQIRLDAYRDNIKGAHLSALDAAFPVCREVLGERYWRQLLTKEITAFGSGSADLNQYGDFLPALLEKAQQKHPELADFSYLHELAALEWQVHQARFAASEPTFDWHAFQTLDTSQQASIRLHLSNQLHVMRFEHPVDALWHAHQHEARKFPPQAPVCCSVHREAPFTVTVTRLDAMEESLLKQLQKGVPLEKLSESQNDTLGILYRWVTRGWIVGFALD